ncbi:hypothetical protein A3F66_04665 [candidate division TM6 bacterium RIFCSPHIGHO2_12_FULL_32_22]|nr:MAG: hypothetical protein A3F66_04665 [candidate division TM6 bacterium RIFCSPHIGHO2_12_FULL_32_22]
MAPSWLVLIPPSLVLLSALTTKKVVPSLILGIISAAFIASNFAPIETIKLTFECLKNQALDIGNLYVFSYLILLGIILAVITKTGGALALGKLLTKRIKNAKSAESTSLTLSIVLAIDDYLNCLTTGFVIRPIADKFKIARIKLSYLINSMTSSTTILIPFSSWAGYLISQFIQSGITTDTTKTILVNADPLSAYLQTIPYIFYSFLIIATNIFIVRGEKGFSTISKHEKIAKETGNLFGGKSPIDTDIKVNVDIEKVKIVDFLLPMLTLLATFFIGVLYSGNFILFGGTNNFVEAFKSAQIIKTLFYVGLITAFITLIFALYRKTINFKEVPELCKEGAILILPGIILIFFAWTFSGLSREYLHTGEYLTGLISGTISLSFLPLIFFLVSGLITIIIGSSWGTISLMLPVAVEIVTHLANVGLPIELNSVCQLLPCLGAIFAGAVAGNHLSPVADISIMTATSTKVYHMDHVKAQFVYAAPVFLCTALAYLISGLIGCESRLLNISLSFGSALITCLIVISLLSRKKN